jgi:hypothetical protein
MEDAAAARDIVASAVPEASSECRTDLAFAAGDWRRAAQIAFNLPGEARFVDRYGAGWMRSLTRYARETGDSKRVLELVQTRGVMAAAAGVRANARDLLRALSR